MEDLAAVELVLVAAVSLAIVVPAGVVAWAILRAGRLPHPAALVAALGVLTGFALVGFMLTELESLATLAGTGLGALAGAVTATFQPRDD